MNTNSNRYTIIYASVMVVIVAFLLAFVSSALKSKQDKNMELDTKKQILSALNVRNVKNAEEAYSKNFILRSGNNGNFRKHSERKIF